jgi:hypothetical protein
MRVGFLTEMLRKVNLAGFNYTPVRQRLFVTTNGDLASAKTPCRNLPNPEKKPVDICMTNAIPKVIQNAEIQSG